MAQAWGAPVAFSVGAALAGVVLAVVAWRLRGVTMPQVGGQAMPAEDVPERAPNAVRLAA
jgi:hypothetical protein